MEIISLKRIRHAQLKISILKQNFIYLNLSKILMKSLVIRKLQLKSMIFSKNLSGLRGMKY